jgi:hypothetical protein
VTTAGGRPAEDEAANLATRSALALGAILVVVAIVGFVPNPIVGDPANGPFIVTGAVLDTIHLASGMALLWVGLALTTRGQGKALIVFGGTWVVLVVLTLLSANLFGILGAAPWYGVNLPGHLLHLALALSAVAVGLIALRSEPSAPVIGPDPEEADA